MQVACIKFILRFFSVFTAPWCGCSVLKCTFYLHQTPSWYCQFWKSFNPVYIQILKFVHGTDKLTDNCFTPSCMHMWGTLSTLPFDCYAVKTTEVNNAAECWGHGFNTNSRISDSQLTDPQPKFYYRLTSFILQCKGRLFNQTAYLLQYAIR